MNLTINPNGSINTECSVDELAELITRMGGNVVVTANNAASVEAEPLPGFDKQSPTSVEPNVPASVTPNAEARSHGHDAPANAKVVNMWQSVDVNVGAVSYFPTPSYLNLATHATSVRGALYQAYNAHGLKFSVVQNATKTGVIITTKCK